MLDTINKPSLSPEDALLVAQTLKSFHAWRDDSNATRMQSSMRSLRFASRIAAKFGIMAREDAFSIMPEELTADSLVLSDDIRLISVIDNTSVSLPNLSSIDIESDPLFGYRAILCFRQITSVYSLIQVPALDTPQLYIVVAGHEQIVEKFVYAVYRAASIYDPKGILISVQAPESWTLEATSLSNIDRCEAMHVVICELLQSPINEQFLEQVRAGFDQTVDGMHTLNLIKCLGGRKRIKKRTLFELRRDIFAIAFSLYRSAIDTFRTVYASKIPLSEQSLSALMAVVCPSKVQQIEFIGCNITETAFSHILYWLARARGSCLRSICLTGNPIGDSAIASLIEILPAVHPQIESLRIGRTDASTKTAAAISHLLCNTQLRKLDISGIVLNPISAEDLSTGIRCSRFLQHFSVSLGVDNVHILFEGLVKSFNPSVTTIVACATQINSRGFAALGKYISKTSLLRNLIISSTGLTSDRLLVLLQAISSNKDQFPFILDISRNHLKDGVAYAFEKLMSGRAPENGIGNLEGLYLGGNGITGSNLKRTCSFLKNLPRLSFVSLDGLESVGTVSNKIDDGVTLATFISRCPQVRCLSVRRALGDRGLRAFCRHMASCMDLEGGNLQTIDVSGNNMSLKTFTAFCKFLSSPAGSELVNLDLDDNNATIACYELLRDELRSHTNVCALNIINDTIALRTSLKDDESQYNLREVLRNLQVITIVNQARLRERELDVPFPLHLCLKNIINLRDEIHDKLSNSISITDTPVCDRRSVFGIDLHLLDSSVPDGCYGPVPIVLQLIVKAMDDMAAYEAEGIFRIAPNQPDQSLVRSFLEYGVYPRCNDVHAIGDVCKQWLRELPTRLFDMLPANSIECVQTPTEANILIQSIPDPWRSTIRYLLSICAKLIQHSKQNKMTPQALAIVLSPNLISEQVVSSAQAIELFNSVQGFTEKAIIYAVMNPSPIEIKLL